MSLSNPLFKRILISLLLGLLFGVILNEATFYFLRDTARAPKRMEFVIPAGTAQKLANGENFEIIPADTTFVVGDTLAIINQDTENHQFGPLWIPANGSASMTLETAEKYTYECSFQSQQMFGLDVHEPLTVWTRIYGILYSGIPLGVLIAIYSVVMPVKEKSHAAA